jgi:UDP-glucose 4-epimerase
LTKALIIGGTGFLGSALCGHLRLQGWDVLSYSRKYPANIDRHAGVNYLVAGERANVALEEAVSESSIVFNLANSIVPALSNDNITDDIRMTVGFNIQVMEFCVKYAVKKYIFASSGGTVYGQSSKFPITEESPTNPVVTYGINKLFSEKYINLFNHNHGLNYSILRIANPFGPGQSPFGGQGIVARYLYSALNGEEFTVFGDGSAVRDYIYIDDVSCAFDSIARYEGSQRIFNVGCGKGLSINELVTSMDGVLDCKPRIRYVGQRTTDISKNYLDISKMATECGWAPTYSLEAGLAKTVDWIRHRYFA